MSNLPIEQMRELARSHERKAKVLWARADRTLSPAVKAKIILQANAEQNSAVYWTMRVRNLTPRPIKVSA